MSQFVVYADFNCPFCYALGERLAPFKGQFDFEWRPIQHVPGRQNLCTLDDMAVLASEVFTVRHRAPDLPIAMPQQRPSTEEATRVFAALQTKDAQLALDFRNLMYRALWVEDQDISHNEVIDQALQELGVSETLGDETARAKLMRWQEEWETGDYDRGIPTIVSDDGRTLSGLVAPGDIQCFLEGRASHDEPSGVCEFIPRPVTLVVGQPRNIWQHVATLNAQSDVLVAHDGKDASIQVAHGLNPDLIIIAAAQPEKLMETWEALQEIPDIKDIPIMVIDSAADPKRHLEFVELGAADYLDLSVDTRLFSARTKLHISTKTRRDRLIRKLAEDPLTRIPNRREFERVIELEWRRGIRSKLALSVAIIDVDHFKKYNDTYGHQAGDLTLVNVATTLSESLRRDSDVVARYGGEEFALVLPDCSETGAQSVTEACRSAVEDIKIDHASSSTSEIVTVSIGVATTVPTAGQNLRELIDAADEALYRAKASGRNRVESAT
jgi:diguanylate cyclase (GGDEF)-like protein